MDVIKWILSNGTEQWMVNSLRNLDNSRVSSFQPCLITIICSEKRKSVQPFQAGINCQQMRIYHNDTLKWRRRQQLIRSSHFLMWMLCAFAPKPTHRNLFLEKYYVRVQIWGIHFSIMIIISRNSVVRS